MINVEQSEAEIRIHGDLRTTNPADARAVIANIESAIRRAREWTNAASLLASCAANVADFRARAAESGRQVVEVGTRLVVAYGVHLRAIDTVTGWTGYMDLREVPSWPVALSAVARGGRVRHFWQGGGKFLCGVAADKDGFDRGQPMCPGCQAEWDRRNPEDPSAIARAPLWPVPTKEIAARIKAHLRSGSIPDMVAAEADATVPTGKPNIVEIRYEYGYRRATEVGRVDAMLYLAWLDAGNVGRHREALVFYASASDGDAVEES